MRPHVFVLAAAVAITGFVSILLAAGNAMASPLGQADGQCDISAGSTASPDVLLG